MGRFLLKSMFAIGVVSLVVFGIAAAVAAMPVALFVFGVVAASLMLATLISLPFMFMRSSRPTATVIAPSTATVVHAHPTVIVDNRPYVSPYSRPFFGSLFARPIATVHTHGGRQNIVTAAPTPVLRGASLHHGATVHGRAGVFNTTSTPFASVPARTAHGHHTTNNMFQAAPASQAARTEQPTRHAAATSHGHR